MKVCLHKLPSGNRLYQAYFGLVNGQLLRKNSATKPLAEEALSCHARTVPVHGESVVDSAEGELGRWIEARKWQEDVGTTIKRPWLSFYVTPATVVLLPLRRVG